MPEYQFHLRHKDVSEPVSEAVDALDDEEARALAELRLLLTGGVAGVTVLRSGVEIVHLERDRRIDPRAAGATGGAVEAGVQGSS